MKIRTLANLKIANTNMILWEGFLNMNPDLGKYSSSSQIL